MPCPNLRRAIIKACFIAAALACVAAGFSYFITIRDVELFKHSLSLWTLVGVVIIINLVSFACFILGFAAWQWVRADLKSPRGDEFE